MTAVWLVFRVAARRRWRPWLAVALLVALVGGAVLASMAAARRTESAYPAFVHRYGFDAAGFAAAPVPQLSRLPEVRSAVAASGPLSAQPRCACSSPVDTADFSVFIDQGPVGTYIKLLAGHLPSPGNPAQALVSFTLSQTYGLHIGGRITVPFFSPSQLQAYLGASGAYPKPVGPTVTFQIVGIEASEGDFPDGQNPSYDLVVGPGFGRVFGSRVAESDVYFVRLRGGAAGLARFSADTTALNNVGLLGYQSVDTANTAVQAAIEPQATGWWVLAGLAALVGLVVVTQALSRQSRLEEEEFATLRTLGMSEVQLVEVGMLRTFAVAVSGAIGAMVVAYALSPLTPLGEARFAEPSTGLSFDANVLLLGMCGLIAAVLLLGALPVLRAARALPRRDRGSVLRPSWLASHLAGAGAPPSIVIGARRAVERGTGHGAAPARAALLGTVLGVTALCATAVFGAGLSNLIEHPGLYGILYELNFNSGAIGSPIEQQVLHDPSVLAVSQGFGSQVAVDQVPVGALALSPVKGSLLVRIIDGRPPSAPGQIALGPSTMREVGARVGSRVVVTLPTPERGARTARFDVVAEVAVPLVSGNTSIGNGVVLSKEGYLDAACPRGLRQSSCRSAVSAASNEGMIVSTVSGGAGARDAVRYLRDDPSVVSAPTTPVSLVNFGQAVNFPLLFALLLVVFAMATLIHVLAVSVVKNRREFAVLRVIGFLPRQVGFSVLWQATASAIIGVVIGVPAGIAVGRTVWLTFASTIGVVPEAVVPGIVLLILVATVVVVANLLAAVPAFLAARPRPHDQLGQAQAG
jgi:putative ABC transport system permease protein